MQKKKHNRNSKIQRPYKCNFCSYRAIQLCTLKDHIIRRHTDDYPFACPVPKCEYKAKIFNDLQTHQKNRHTPTPQISCNFEGCIYKTRFKRELKCHVLSCHNTNRKKSVECPLCQQKFFKDGQMRDHLMTHTKEKPWQCSECIYESKSKGHLQRHVESLHGKLEISSDRRILKCDVCDFTTTFTDRLKAHVYSHCKEQLYTCKSIGCNFRTKWKHHLEIHEIRNHAPERHPCPKLGCKYVAGHSMQLRSHIACVHRKQFHCKFPGCNRQCITEAALLNHQKLHDPERLFECEQCHLRFKTKTTLQGHFQSRHREEKHLQCPHCEYRTNRKSSLRSHLRRMHRAEDIICAESGCNFKSCSPYDMKYHSKRHDSKSHPFKCDFCPIGFTHDTGLTKHVKREHSDVSKQSLRNRSTTSNPANLGFRNDWEFGDSVVMKAKFP